MADFIREEDIKQHWKYTLSEFTFLYNGKTYEVPKDKVTEISIENNYENDLFPVTKVKLTLEPSVYQEMIQNKNTVKIKIRLQKFYTKNDSEEKSLLRDCINTTFSLLMDDEFLDPDRSVHNKQSELTGEKKDDKNDVESMSMNSSDLPIYKYETMEAMRTTINDVLTNQTMMGAIVYIAEKVKMSVGSMIISPLENNKSYKEILLPPQSALSTFQYIDSQYGFYKAGSTIFFGIDRSYIINFKGGCTAYEREEIKETTIMIPDKGGLHGSLECGLEKVDEKNLRNYVIVKADHIDMKNQSVSNDMLEGNVGTFINTNTGSIMSASGQSMQRGGGNPKIVNTNTSNPWIGETYAVQKAAESAVATLSCGEFDMDVFTPNKKFSFVFEDTTNGEKYKGTYMLMNAVYKLTKNGNDFMIDGSLTFKRPNMETKVNSEDL